MRLNETLQVVLTLGVCVFLLSRIAYTVSGQKAEPGQNEQVNWQVISSGGNMNGASANFRLSGTAGQTAIGIGTSGVDQVHHGFWQYFGCCNKAGDANNDGSVNVGDQVYIDNYIFRPWLCETSPPKGCPPDCMAEGDANGDGSINVGDDVFLSNYVFRPPPLSPVPQCGPEK